MPTLICPHCQTPQVVSDEVYQKNLGKKCRCRQCQKTFTIEAQAPPPAAVPGGFGDFDFLNVDSPAPAPAKSKAAAKPAAAAPLPPAAEPEGLGDFDFLNVDAPAPAPAAPPPAPAKPKAAAKSAPSAPSPPAAPPAEELDFSGLRAGSGSVTVADLPDFASPAAPSPAVAEIPEFPSFDDIAPATAQAAAPKAKAPLTRLPQPADDDDEGGDVARLPDRAALKTMSSLLRLFGWAHFPFIGLAVLGGLYVINRAPNMEQRLSAFASIMLPILMLSASAAFWFAFAELIHLGLGMEARLHEISRRIGSRS